MTPTPQQIIELAREAEIGDSHGYIIRNESPKLQRFAILLLERFGQAKEVKQEPVAFAIEAGICEMRVAGVHLKREAAEAWVSEIKSATRVRPLVFGDTHPAPAEVREPLTIDELAELMPDDHTPMSLGEAFVKFARLVEQAHGITGGKK